MAGSSCGTTLIDLLGGPIITHLGWRYVFFISGGAGFVWLFFWILTVTSSPDQMTRIHPSEVKWIMGPGERTRLLDSRSYRSLNHEEINNLPPPFASSSKVGSWDALKILMTKQSFWTIVLDYLCINWGYYIMLTWLPTYVNAELGFNLYVTTFIAVTPYISSAILGMIGGRVCDRMIVSGYKLVYVRKGVFAIGMTLYTVTFVLMALMKPLGITPVVAAVILAVGTSGGGLQVPGHNANIYDIAPNHPSVVVGFANTAATIPGIIGVYSTGILLESASGGWPVVWLVTAGFYFLAMVTFALFANTKRVV